MNEAVRIQNIFHCPPVCLLQWHGVQRKEFCIVMYLFRQKQLKRSTLAVIKHVGRSF